MADNTIIQQGSFVSNGEARTLQLRSDVDWIKVYNLTVGAATPVAAVAAEWYWQRGFASNFAWTYYKSNAANALNLIRYQTPGFTLVDSSVQVAGNPVALTAISNANPPVVTTASTAALSTGNVVRINDVTGAQQLGGIDFDITVLNGTTFALRNMSAIVAGTAGFYSVVPFDPMFYPRRRFITKISQATNALITLSVLHGYTVGQEVRFNVAPEYGMVQMNGLKGTIIAIGTADADGVTNTITVNINSTAFTPFVFPLNAAVPFTPAQVIPFGEDTAFALSVGADILADSTVNTAYIGIILAAGANNPAGVNADQIYWRAGKSFSNTVVL